MQVWLCLKEAGAALLVGDLLYHLQTALLSPVSHLAAVVWALALVQVAHKRPLTQLGLEDSQSTLPIAEAYCQSLLWLRQLNQS